jgi:hypothetical protein
MDVRKTDAYFGTVAGRQVRDVRLSFTDMAEFFDKTGTALNSQPNQ